MAEPIEPEPSSPSSGPRATPLGGNSKRLALVIVVAGFAVAAFIVLRNGSGDGHAVQGTVRVKTNHSASFDYASNEELGRLTEDGAACVPSATYGLPRAQLVVKASDGAVVAVTQLDEGRNQFGKGKELECVLRFEVTVPSSDFYTFEIAGQDDPITYSKKELDASDWSINLAKG